jgi:hypothetical protein
VLIQISEKSIFNASKTLRANGAFQAVPLVAGKNNVLMLYQDEKLHAGTIISASAACLAIALLIWPSIPGSILTSPALAQTAQHFADGYLADSGAACNFPIGVTLGLETADQSQCVLLAGASALWGIRWRGPKPPGRHPRIVAGPGAPCASCAPSNRTPGPHLAGWPILARQD